MIFLVNILILMIQLIKIFPIANAIIKFLLIAIVILTIFTLNIHTFNYYAYTTVIETVNYYYNAYSNYNY